MSTQELPVKVGRNICPYCKSRNTNALDEHTYECYDCGKEYKKPWKKIIPHTAQWERLANQMVRSYHSVNACKVCGHPCEPGYCCDTCGSSDP